MGRNSLSYFSLSQLAFMGSACVFFHNQGKMEHVRPSSCAFFLLFGSLLLATSRTCAAAPIVGTQAQAEQLVSFVRSATDAATSHLQVLPPPLRHRRVVSPLHRLLGP